LINAWCDPTATPQVIAVENNQLSMQKLLRGDKAKIWRRVQSDPDDGAIIRNELTGSYLEVNSNGELMLTNNRTDATRFFADGGAPILNLSGGPRGNRVSLIGVRKNQQMISNEYFLDYLC
jgi:hypothetical protein